MVCLDLEVDLDLLLLLDLDLEVFRFEDRFVILVGCSSLKIIVGSSDVIRFDASDLRPISFKYFWSNFTAAH